MKLSLRLALAATAAIVVAVMPCFAQRSNADPARILSFEGNAGWVNGAPLTAADLQGKVVLVDFWEYTCLNCLRTLPYLREWYKRYHQYGFVIVGVHSPEFNFSGESANVASAAKRLDVTWPVVLDDHMTVWKRYGNDVWPHEYLFDRSGNLVDSVAGEGRYPQTEAKIQELLRAGGPKLALPPVMALLPQDSYDKPGAVCYPQTAEILVGHAPILNASGMNDPAQDTSYAYHVSDPKDGGLYLQGYWHLSKEAAVSGESGGFLALKYHAIQVTAVLRPEGHGTVRVDVMQDGKPIARGDAGKDVAYDASGKSYVNVDAARSYDLLLNAKFGEHELRLYPQGYGLGIYDFAFESCEIPKSG